MSDVKVSKRLSPKARLIIVKYLIKKIPQPYVFTCVKSCRFPTGPFNNCLRSISKFQLIDFNTLNGNN